MLALHVASNSHMHTQIHIHFQTNTNTHTHTLHCAHMQTHHTNTDTLLLQALYTTTKYLCMADRITTHRVQSHMDKTLIPYLEQDPSPGR